MAGSCAFFYAVPTVIDTMLKKTAIYYSSGGLSEVVGYIFAYLKKKIFYTSKTVYLYRELAESPADSYAAPSEFRVIRVPDELESLHFERVETLNYRQWFSKGSYVVVGFSNGIPVSFSWSHFRYHKVDHVTAVDLGEDAVWIGPTFVDKSMRGNGMNKAQIAYQIGCLPQGIHVCLTSANINNAASLRSFERLGFHQGAMVVQKQGLFSRQSCVREYLGSGESFIRFLDHA